MRYQIEFRGLIYERSVQVDVRVMTYLQKCMEDILRTDNIMMEVYVNKYVRRSSNNICTYVLTAVMCCIVLSAGSVDLPAATSTSTTDTELHIA